MNKDALLATLIGFGVGLLITGVLLLSPSIAKYIPKIALPDMSAFFSSKRDATTPTPAPSVSLPTSLTIQSPIPDQIERTSSLLVSGTAPAGLQLMIEGGIDEEVVIADAEGKFAGTVLLAEGKNEIVVTSYKDGKAQESKTIPVYFTQEEF